MSQERTERRQILREVIMQGRRRHARFSFSKTDGVLTVLRDVVVQIADTGDLVVVDVEPRQPGELLTIQMVAGDRASTVPVEVIASRPILRHGQVQHQIFMKRLEDVR